MWVQGGQGAGQAAPTSAFEWRRKDAECNCCLLQAQQDEDEDEDEDKDEEEQAGPSWPFDWQQPQLDDFCRESYKE